MNRLLMLLLVWIFLVPGAAFAAGPSVPLDAVKVNVHDRDALQRGAKLFAGYCMACHSAQYMRYTHVARDLGWSAEEMRENFLFTRNEAGDPTPMGDMMQAAISDKDAIEWFGVVPPDLTLAARLFGEDWMYTFLRSFYLDESRPLGVNNSVFASIGMPHPLWELQGYQEKVGYENKRPVFELTQPGGLSPEEYDAVVQDLVTFMTYLAEPIKLQRESIGPWVLLFLAGLTFLFYLLKKEYWKDVH